MSRVFQIIVVVSLLLLSCYTEKKFRTEISDFAKDFDHIQYWIVEPLLHVSRRPSKNIVDTIEILPYFPYRREYHKLPDSTKPTDLEYYRLISIREEFLDSLTNRLIEDYGIDAWRADELSSSKLRQDSEPGYIYITLPIWPTQPTYERFSNFSFPDVEARVQILYRRSNGRKGMRNFSIYAPEEAKNWIEALPDIAFQLASAIVLK